MSIIVIDGLDNRTSSDTVKNYCQNFGRVINCYNKGNQCLVAFADKYPAEEFIRASPHRIDSNGPVHATWKSTFERNSSAQSRPISTNVTDPCRLIIRGTSEQLEEKNLVRYFSRYGHIRMCLANPNQESTTITFDDRMSAERALREPRHFLNGRSLIVQSESQPVDSNKRMKTSDPPQPTVSTLTSQFEYEKTHLLVEQRHLQSQLQQQAQLHEYEKQQWNHYLTKQQMDYLQQINHYQTLVKQSIDEVTHRNQQIEQLKQENKDLE